MPHTNGPDTGVSVEPRARLRALHDELARQGATVTLHDLDALPDDTVVDLVEEAAARLRAIAEGTRTGWVPADRRGGGG